MSAASKRTLFITSILTAVVIAGVHYGQKVESENMYAGVIKDDERRAERASAKAAALLAGEGDFEAPVAPLAGQRSPEEREREMRARAADFERSRERERRLAEEQGISPA